MNLKKRTAEERERAHQLFRRTGHFTDCQKRGCDATRCAEARFVSRWNEWGQVLSPAFN